MSEQEDPSQKTEEPTEQKLKEAYQKGQTVYSREITHCLVLIILTIIIAWLSPRMANDAKMHFSTYIENSYQISLDSGNLGHLFLRGLRDLATILIIPLLLIVTVSIFSSIAQNQGRLPLAVNKITPKLSNISIFTGFKKLFSIKSIFELVKSCIKLVTLSVVCYFAVNRYIIKLSSIHDYSLDNILSFLVFLIVKIMIAICISMALIALFDYFYQRFEFYKTMRMTKQELKDEFKKSEGSPEIKTKLKKIRSERARRRMMSAISKADAIVTNPEHFAIAIEYSIATMKAPKVTAKGKNHLAIQIRLLAEKYDIPIIENPPLARALYASVEIDQEIPVEHYKAVAEIISFVYKLKGKKAS